MQTNISKQQHWDNIYQTKKPNEVSWTQKNPTTSLNYIQSLQLPKNASIIDVGGGESNVVDCLLEQGYNNITVVDISAKAIEKTKERLGNKAKNVQWIVSDILSFRSTTKYDVWHDRASFHFLTTEDEINNYITLASNTVNKYMLIATFSDKGPTQCSGLNITQYTAATLAEKFKHNFEKIQSKYEDHLTPFNTVQNFLFSLFKKK